MSPIRLSTKQRAALAHLSEVAPAPVSPLRLARVLSTSPEGAAATASSLVRRGLASRVRYLGSVHYTTKEGR